MLHCHSSKYAAENQDLTTKNFGYAMNKMKNEK